VSANFVRVGETVINLDNVMSVDLNVTYDDDEPDQIPRVVVNFLLRGWDRLDKGDNVTEPYLEMFEEEEADALRKYFETIAPDLVLD
jgi:hypothetical protein